MKLISKINDMSENNVEFLKIFGPLWVSLLLPTLNLDCPQSSSSSKSEISSSSSSGSAASVFSIARRRALDISSNLSVGGRSSFVRAEKMVSVRDDKIL